MKFNMGNAQELLVDDLELLLREINDFCGTNEAQRGEIPKILENYLLYVAKTGNTVFPWQQVRPLFRSKMQSSIATFSEEPMTMENTVYERFDLFRAAPFTIQRFSELITDPKRHYKLKEKYLFALEKAVYVVSTVEPSPPTGDDMEEANGNADNDSVESEMSYHELNSTFNVTPPDTQTLAVALADPVASGSTETNTDIPLLTASVCDEMQEAPLEVSCNEEMTVTVSCEPPQESMIAEHKVVSNDAVEPLQESTSNESSLNTGTNYEVETTDGPGPSQPQTTMTSEMESVLVPESILPDQQPEEEKPVAEVHAAAVVEKEVVDPVNCEVKAEVTEALIEKPNIIEQVDSEVEQSPELSQVHPDVGAGDVGVVDVAIPEQLEETPQPDAPVVVSAEETHVVTDELVNVSVSPQLMPGKVDDEKMDVDESESAQA